MSLRQLCWFCLVLLWCPLAAHAGNLLVFGDSLSAGYGIAREQAWPSLLQQRLDAEGYRYTVVNASVSGETTAGGRSRLPALLAQHKPTLVVLELGANDGLRGLPIKAMEENLAAMIKASRTSGAQVLLVGMEMPPNLGPLYTRQFSAAYRDQAKANGLRLVPFLFAGFAEQRDAFQADGLHPTAAQQPRMLDTIWKELKPLLKRS